MADVMGSCKEKMDHYKKAQLPAWTASSGLPDDGFQGLLVSSNLITSL